jgi:hypothetical protein
MSLKIGTSSATIDAVAAAIWRGHVGAHGLWERFNKYQSLKYQRKFIIKFVRRSAGV